MGLLDSIAPGKKKRESQAGNSTQTHLRIGEIRDNVLVLKNGGVRAVLKTSSINFNLKSEQEQNAIIYSYQGFLNSLEFPIQISIRSKKLDVDNYIEQVNALAEKQENKLLQEQTFEYSQYIKRLVEYADIMEKEFYVIVPYDPGSSKAGPGRIQSFFQRLSPKDSYSDIKKRRNEFNKLKKSLLQRVSTVKNGLEGCGLSVETVDTIGLINLYYESYNPQTSREQKLKDLEGTSVETDEERISNEEKQRNIEAEELKKNEQQTKQAPQQPQQQPAKQPEQTAPQPKQQTEQTAPQPKQQTEQTAPQPKQQTEQTAPQPKQQTEQTANQKQKQIKEEPLK